MTDYQYSERAYWLEMDESNLSIYVSWLTEEEILETIYLYLPVGNRIQEVVDIDTQWKDYAYDAENRLTAITGTAGQTFAYDNNGNMLEATAGTDTTEYTYDYENRLVQVVLPSPSALTVTYGYLPNGDRISRQTSTETIYWLYDRENIITEYTGSFVINKIWTHGLGTDEPVAIRVQHGGGSLDPPYFYILDALGSVVALEQGGRLVRYTYDAFGTLHDYSADIIARENPYLFTGREYDWQTGLYYYRARSYSSALGRFLQRDPEGMVDGANMYVYCGNEPVNKVDPSGKWPGFKIDKNKYKQCLTQQTTSFLAGWLSCIITVVTVTVLFSFIFAVGVGAVTGGAVSLAAIGLFVLMLAICAATYWLWSYIINIFKCAFKSMYWSWW